MRTAPGYAPTIPTPAIRPPQKPTTTTTSGKSWPPTTCCVTPLAAPTLRRLAALKPKTIALMHGPSFKGDGGAALGALAAYYEARPH